MRLNAHCFIDEVVFDPLPTQFPIRDGMAWISINHGPYKSGEKQEVLGSILHYKVLVDPNEFLRPEDHTHDHSIQFKKIGELLDKYRGIMYEIAATIEGLISISTIKSFPPFRIQQVMINLTADTHEEQEMIDKELISYTFGDVGVAREKQNIVVNGIDKILVPIATANDHLSALAIYTTGVRALERFDMEVAFSSFFRVIEGYLGDGSSRVEQALLKKETEVTSLLKITTDTFAALHRILTNLSLPITSKDKSDNRGIISDIVLLRHKLMHYNLKQQDHHFYSAMRIDLRYLVNQLHRAAFFLIREDIELK